MSEVADKRRDNLAKARAAKAAKAEQGERRRKKGLTINGERLKLRAPQIPGYFCRWFNDDGNRIAEYTQNNDYDFVTRAELQTHGQVGTGPKDENTDSGQKVSVVVGTKDDGSPLRAYLLKIRKDWYDEDQREKQKAVSESVRAMKRGSVEGQYGSVKID